MKKEVGVKHFFPQRIPLGIQTGSLSAGPHAEVPFQKPWTRASRTNDRTKTCQFQQTLHVMFE